MNLLAIFAHPDDELYISPILSRYAREGVTCRVAVVTDGRFGIAPHMGGLAGDPLAALRAGEMLGATRALGIEEPILMGFCDGFAHKTPELREALALKADLFRRVDDLLIELKPNALVTFGPDGMYGHPDHCLVGDVVTTVYQSQQPGSCRLFYPGIPSGKPSLPIDPDGQHVMVDPVPVHYGLDPSRLPVAVAYAPEDAERASRSLECHRSQFSPETMGRIQENLRRRDRVFFRPFDGNSEPGETLLQP